jgi:uncharacterized membrane-anchored protein YjiN (DUF445 family)
MTEEEKLERRESLSEDAIEDVVRKTLQRMNGEKDIIANRATDRIVKEMSKKFHLDFEDEEEKKQFKASIPQLIELNKYLNTTKKSARWIVLLLLAWALQDVFAWVWETSKALYDWIEVLKISGK